MVKIVASLHKGSCYYCKNSISKTFFAITAKIDTQAKLLTVISKLLQKRVATLRLLSKCA